MDQRLVRLSERRVAASIPQRIPLHGIRKMDYKPPQQYDNKPLEILIVCWLGSNARKVEHTDCVFARSRNCGISVMLVKRARRR